MTPTASLTGAARHVVVVVGYFVTGLPGTIAAAVTLATLAPLAVPMARLLLRRPSAAPNCRR